MGRGIISFEKGKPG